MKTTTTNSERLGFKTYFGSMAMNGTEGFAAALMTSFFMVYLTDYAGIGSWAAVMGSTILFAARIFDAINDPIQGWIMDRAKIGKYGKYKPFIILSIVLMTIGISALFFIPTNLSSSPVFISVWVLFFYLLVDIGGSFGAPNLIYRTLTLDGVQRGKLMVAPRLQGIVLGIFSAALITIVNAVNRSVGNLHTSFGITVGALMAFFMFYSLIGISFIKEKYHAKVDENTEKVRLRDIFLLIKENKALRVKVTSQLFSGFIWSFLFAATIYYIKWAYCADLATGAVNTELFGLFSLGGAMLSLVPTVLGTVIAMPLMKKFKSAIRMHRFMVLLESVACGIMFLLQIIGVLQSSPVLFFICSGIASLGVGANFIPEETVNIECMDYEIYSNGKDRSALCNVCNKFINKAQSAFSAAIVGVLLVAIGYVVDSSTDTFLGDLTSIPSMLNGFVVIMGLIPLVLGLISWLILKQYPVTDEIRTEMKLALDKKDD
jgi:Na+/melibiose symporter-like transporter